MPGDTGGEISRDSQPNHEPEFSLSAEVVVIDDSRYEGISGTVTEIYPRWGHWIYVVHGLGLGPLDTLHLDRNKIMSKQNWDEVKKEMS